MERRSGKKRYIVEIDIENAVMLKEFGWICDCGLWTFGDDSNHFPLNAVPEGVVDVFSLESISGKKIDFVEEVIVPKLKWRCDECKKRFDDNEIRRILGVWVCHSCYARTKKPYGKNEYY